MFNQQNLRSFFIAFGLFWANYSSAQTNVQVHFPDTFGLTGTTLCMPVRVSNFNDISAYNWELKWDPSVATFEQVIASNVVLNFEPSFAGLLSPGRMTVGWSHITAGSETLPDDALLFTLCFKLIGQTGSSTLLTIDSFSQVPGVGIGFFSSNGNVVFDAPTNPSGKLTIGTSNEPAISGVSGALKYPDYTIAPNPAQTTIRFASGDDPNQIPVRAIVMDQLGRVVSEHLNTNEIDVSSYPSGVYILQLMDNNGAVGLKKFVKQ
jgi:hypothetical protein